MHRVVYSVLVLALTGCGPSTSTPVPKSEDITACLLRDNHFAVQLIRGQLDELDLTDPERWTLQRRQESRDFIRRADLRVKKALRTAEEEGRADLIKELTDYCAARAKRGDLTRFIERDIARMAARD